MSKPPDTDFAQFEDTLDVGRRFTDEIQVEDCHEESCTRIVLVERRLNRHRKDIDELKTMLITNSTMTNITKSSQ
jgi:hypothetical protein